MSNTEYVQLSHNHIQARQYNAHGARMVGFIRRTVKNDQVIIEWGVADVKPPEMPCVSGEIVSVHNDGGESAIESAKAHLEEAFRYVNGLTWRVA